MAEHTEQTFSVPKPKMIAKLDRLHDDYKRLHKWALENVEGNDFAQQVAWYAASRLEEWDLPLEEWEP